MRHRIANWFNECGRQASDRGNKKVATHWYRLATFADPRWSVPWYNSGLIAKYLYRWQQSLLWNQKAVSLNPTDEAAWWNLGIAATALRNWPEAARAWHEYGIELLQDDRGEITTSPATACVRLNPNGEGEVVWGERIDPARFLILNVPLPESRHRFRDIVLHDGAPNGERQWNGQKFPVFDELEIWQRSQYSTFRVSVNVPSDLAKQRLTELCKHATFGIEDWGTIRMICAQCSRGSPGPHDCKASEVISEKTFALAAHSEIELRALLDSWTAEFTDAGYHSVETVLAA